MVGHLVWSRFWSRSWRSQRTRSRRPKQLLCLMIHARRTNYLEVQIRDHKCQSVHYHRPSHWPLRLFLAMVEMYRQEGPRLDVSELTR